MISIRRLALTLVLLSTGFTCIQAATHGLGSGLSVSYKSPAAPNLRLKSLLGKVFDLSTMRDRVVVVNFWATWCPPCIEELPSMQKLWEETHGGGSNDRGPHSRIPGRIEE